MAVVWEVLLPLPTVAAPGANGVPWNDFINLTPLVNTEFGADMFPTIFLFLPLGVLLPLLARVRSAWQATLIGLLCSRLGIAGRRRLISVVTAADRFDPALPSEVRQYLQSALR